MTRTTTPPRGDLTHPSMLAAIAVLVVNDHLLKGSGWLPGWLTGKLSDLAGLYFFPVLLVVVAERLGRRPRSLNALVATVLTGAVFAALKVSPTLAQQVSRVLVIVCDPSDLVALPMLVASHRHLTRHVPRRPAPRWMQATTVLFAALASMATSPSPATRRGFALWKIASSSPHPLGCSQVEAWVSRSGKQGVGVTLRFLSPDPACVAQIREARLELPGGQVATSLALPRTIRPGIDSEPPPEPSPPSESVPDPAPPEHGAYVYLPFPFDAEEAWNQGERTATLHIRLLSEGIDDPWELPLKYLNEGYNIRLPDRYHDPIPRTPSPRVAQPPAQPVQPPPTGPTRTFAQPPPSPTAPATPGGAR